MLWLLYSYQMQCALERERERERGREGGREGEREREIVTIAK